jgi:hypothetical protein
MRGEEEEKEGITKRRNIRKMIQRKLNNIQQRNKIKVKRISFR